MTVNDNESYLNYLNKLGDKYKKKRTIVLLVKNPLNADYSAAPKKIETNPKAPKSSS